MDSVSSQEMDSKKTRGSSHKSKATRYTGGGTRTSHASTTSKTTHTKSHVTSKSTVPGQRGKLPVSEPSQPQVVVLDDDGKDVTPKSLLKIEPTATGLKGDYDPLQSGRTSPSSEHSDMDAARISSAGFSRSGLTSTGSGTPDGLSGSKTPEAEAESTESPREGGGEAAAKADTEEKAEVITEDILNAQVELQLKETDTFWLLTIPGTCVAMDSTFAGTVQMQNQRYKELKKNKQEMADLYAERAAQTFNDAPKHKEVQSSPASTAESGCQSSNWDIYDSMNDYGEMKDTGDGVSPVGQPSAETFTVPTAAAGGGAGDSSKGVKADFNTSTGSGSSLGAKGASFSASGTTNANQSTSRLSSFTEPGVGVAAAPAEASEEGKEKEKREKEMQAIKHLRNLPNSLRVVERMVTQNNYHHKHLMYRNIHPGTSDPAPPGAHDTGTPGLQFLWGYECEMTKDRNVSCIVWNHTNQDLLAVSYGEFDFTKQNVHGPTEGLILFWSLKNPEYPEKVVATPSGVTCVAFSMLHPNLLAAGFYDGTVGIYDVRKPDNKPMLESGHTSGKHADPVWQLKWVDKGSERGEALVSISTDGRVTQWSMKKGLEHTDLMKLKRVTSASKQSASEKTGGASGAASTGSSEGIISRRASGLCFDFSIKDPNIYIAGTEDGHIHKCSCSYNEQHLENYFGHAGPVYKLRWSPWCPNTFLSCSADWTIKLWNQEQDAPVLSFQSTTDYVADICWSPLSSTIFGSVTGDGRIEVWDLAISTLDPIVVMQQKCKLSAIVFSLNSPVIVTGDDSGALNVYKLTGTIAEELSMSFEQQRERLEKVMSPSPMDEL